MCRRRGFNGILLSWILALAPLDASAHPGTHDGVIEFGSQLLYVKDGCLSVHGTLSAGSFFQDLRRIDIGGQLEYKKRGQVVKEYPESLTASIDIDQCLAPSPYSTSSIFLGDWHSFKFEVNWKHEMQLRPAVLSPAVAHCARYSPIGLLGEDPPSIRCEMMVASKGVPLADHLIVLVFAADGRRLTRLSAAP
jgi:hypothetical protein